MTKPEKRTLLDEAINNGIRDVPELKKMLESHGLMADEEVILRRIAKHDERVADAARSKIYVDGSFENGIMGIGVVSDDLDIKLSQTQSGGTCNVAECLAVIRACEECDARGITGVKIHSDSQLVVCWTAGSYQLKSRTAQQYVPTIREWLRKIDATLVWIPGSTNPADAYSRGGCQPATRSPGESLLDFIARTPMESLRYQHFARLKCGRDQFSSMRLAKLIAEVGEEIHTIAQQEFDDEKQVASCLRWHLRGLPIEKAIRKVATDTDISQEIRDRRRQD